MAVMEKDDQQHILSRAAFDAVIFDLDGVVTDTASLHSEAWKRTFDAFLDSRAGTKGETAAPFDIDTDYRDYVDGRPRYDGVRRFLASRDITLPEGTGDDVPGDGTIHALATGKTRSTDNYLPRGGRRRSGRPSPSSMTCGRMAIAWRW